jgi:hypothetical protein
MAGLRLRRLEICFAFLFVIGAHVVLAQDLEAVSEDPPKVTTTTTTSSSSKDDRSKGGAKGYVQPH